jgi:hypothetical protein
MLAPRTGDSESGYWLNCPTPTVKGNYNKAGLSDKSGDGLATWAAQFPTPTSTPYGTRNNGHRPDGSTYRTAGAPSLDTMARRAMWPTPLATDGSHGGPNQAGGKGDLRLSSAVARSMLPTPTANNASNNGSPSQHRRNALPLDAVAGGPLNPTWVEWLMGCLSGGPPAMPRQWASTCLRGGSVAATPDPGAGRVIPASPCGTMPT